MIIAAAIISSLVHSCLSQPKVGLSIAWSVDFLEIEEIESLSNVLNKRVLGDTSNEIAEVSLFFTNEDDPSFMVNYYNRLMAMLSAGSIDIFIVDRDTMITHSSREFIWPLDIVLDEIKVLNPALYEKIVNEAGYTMFGLDENNQTSEITGIRITNSPLMKELGYDIDNDIFFCMAVSTQKLGRVVKTLMLFFE